MNSTIDTRRGRTSLRQILRGSSAVLLAFVLAGIATSAPVSADVVPGSTAPDIPSFGGCAPEAFLVQTTASQFDVIDLVSGNVEVVTDNEPGQINGIGFNVTDNRIWGYARDYSALQGQPYLTVTGPAAVGGTFVTERVGPMNMTADSYFVGDVDADGRLYLATPRGATVSYSVVDVNAASGTYHQELESGSIDIVPRIADWAFSPVDGFLYTVNAPNATEQSELIRIDPGDPTDPANVWTFTSLGPSGLTETGGFGAMYFDADGFLYVSANNSGEISRINTQAVTAGDYDESRTAVFSAAGASTANDGARCLNAPVPIDFGDAPDSYGTLFASEGPFHGVRNYDGQTSTVYLGTSVDLETNGLPGVDADGDDLQNLDDEDGVTFPPLTVGSTTYFVEVVVTNNAQDDGAGAPDGVLVGWIDFDGNGTFDADESASVTVPNGSTEQTTTLTWNISDTLVPQTIYARFRISTQLPTENDNFTPTSGAFDGEVEDYPVEIVTPSIELVKSVSSVDDTNGSGRTDAGDTVNYSFTVTNTGPVPLSGVSVSDDLLTVVGGPVDLGVGGSDSTSFTGSYVLTQDDVNAGGVENTATASGTDPNGVSVSDVSDAGTDPSGASVDDPAGTETGSPLGTNPNDADDPTEDPTTFLVDNTPSIELVKSVSSVDDTNGSGRTDAGDTVNYSFTVTNTGPVPLSGVSVSDDLLTVVGGPVDLGVGGSDSTSFTGSYVLTQDDVNAGGVENTATASGTDPNGVSVSDVSDAGTDPSGASVDDPAGTETGSPLGTNPNDADDPTEDPTTFLVDNTPSIELVKSVSSVDDTNGSGRTDAGDTVNYSFTVTNTGPVPLSGVSVSDDLLTVVGGPVDLGVGGSDSTSFTGSYVLTQDDVNAGGVENTATASGTDPNGVSVSDVSDAGTDPSGASVDDPAGTETGSPLGTNPNDADDPTEDPTTFLVDNTPSIELVKSVSSVDDTNGSGRTDAGDTVNYSFTVTNTGPVPLSGVSVSDDLLTVVGGPVDLGVGGSDSTSFTGSYVLTQDDVNAGGVENTATASGTAPNGQSVTDVSDAGTTAEGSPIDDPSETETESPLGENPNDPDDPTDDPTTVLTDDPVPGVNSPGPGPRGLPVTGSSILATLLVGGLLVMGGLILRSRSRRTAIR